MSRPVDKPDKEKDNDEEIPAQESPNPILRHRPKTRTSPPSAHARGDWPCMQAGNSLPQRVLASQKKKTRKIIHYGRRRRRRRRRRNTLLALLLYCCCCSSSSSASLFLLQNYRSGANTVPKKRPKQQCQKKTLLLDSISFFRSLHKPQQKSSQISLTKSCLHFRPDMYYNHGRESQTDTQTDRARAHEKMNQNQNQKRTKGRGDGGTKKKRKKKKRGLRR